MFIIELFTNEDLEQYLEQNQATENASTVGNIHQVDTHHFNFGANPAGYIQLTSN